MNNINFVVTMCGSKLAHTMQPTINESIQSLTANDLDKISRVGAREVQIYSCTENGRTKQVMLTPHLTELNETNYLLLLIFCGMCNPINYLTESTKLLILQRCMDFVPFFSLLTNRAIWIWFVHNTTKVEFHKAIFSSSPRVIDAQHYAIAEVLNKYHHEIVNESHWLISSIADTNKKKILTFADKMNIDIPITSPVYGYKAFAIIDEDGNKLPSNTLRCRSYLFDINKDHHQNVVYPCYSGFHFCKIKQDVRKFYFMDSDVVVHKVMAWGTVLRDEDKCVTSNLRILEQVKKPAFRKGL